MSLPNPLGLLTGGAGKVLDALGGVLDRITTTDEEKLKAKAELARIMAEHEIELAKVDAQFAAERSKVLVAEAQSESWLTRNWRPILMLSFTLVILHNYVISPIFGVPSSDMPPDLWQVIKIGVGGYIVSRGVENVASYAPDVAAHLGRRQDPTP